MVPEYRKNLKEYRRHPDLFAAAVPIEGGGDVTKASTIKHIPIWAFHGDADRTVPVRASRDMIAALKKAGGSPKYTEYKGVNHSAARKAFNAATGLDKWLFARKKEGAVGRIDEAEYGHFSSVHAGLKGPVHARSVFSALGRKMHIPPPAPIAVSQNHRAGAAPSLFLFRPSPGLIQP